MTIAELLKILQELLLKTPQDQLYCPPLKRRIIVSLVLALLEKEVATTEQKSIE